MSPISFEPIAGLAPELQRAFQAASQAERRPIGALNERKELIQSKVDLLGDILKRVDGVKKIIPELNSPIAIRELGVFSSDEKIITGTADKYAAEPGIHNIEVLQLASRATAMSNGFEDKDSTTVGTGYFTFTTASGETKDVFVDNDNATLEGVAKIVNHAKVGVKATVFYDASSEDAPYRLLFTAEGVGSGNNVEYPDFYFVDGEEDFSIEKSQPASNARIRYEGFEVESPTNEIKDLIQGATLNLKGVTEAGRPTNVTIGQDIPKTKLKVKDLVDNLNQVLSFIQDQNKMDEHTDTRRTLGGDYGIRTAESRIRSALGTTLFSDNPKTIRVLGDIGIMFNRNGTLDFDEKKFENALNANFDGVVELLTGDGIQGGVIPRLSTALSSISDSSAGVLGVQRKNYVNRIKEIDKNVATKEATAQRKDEFLKQKLARLQGALGALQGQSSQLSSAEAGGALTSTLLNK